MDEVLIKFRHNVMNVLSFHTFENIKGSYIGNCRDVYFIRAIGANASLKSDILQMDEALGRAMDEGRCLYKRITALPAFIGAEDADFYTEVYRKWAESGKKALETKATAGQDKLKSVAGQACASVAKVYGKAKGTLTSSIEKNLIVKMAFWLDNVTDGFLNQWNERICIKIAAQNVSKKQEYLFYYMLTLLGADVLLIQNEADIDRETETWGLSEKFVLGSLARCELPAYEYRKAHKAQEQADKAAPGRKETAREESRVRVRIPDRRPAGTESPANHSRAAREKTFEELAALAASVVMIEIHDHSGKILGTGSGIMIGEKGYILTNNHVASGGRYYSVRIENDEQSYRTDEVIKYNPVLDLAVIRIGRTLRPLPVYQGKQKLLRGQKVVAIGSPLGLFNSVSDGIISGFRIIDNVDMIQFTAPISHGSSGGAVLNLYGDVIGISTAGFDDGQNINLAVGYESINNFIRGFT